MQKEKEARRACKIEICTAFAKAASGAPITCDVTKTWTQQEITEKMVGGSYIWRYGHAQCTVKLVPRDNIAKSVTEAKAVATFPEHAFICNVDDKDPAKSQAFSVHVAFTPAISFENGQVKSVAIEPVKTEGSAIASAAVSSLTVVDKVSGVVSRAAAAEINTFLFEKCKEDGVEITPKQ